MAGNYALPFRPLPPGSNNPYALPNHLSGCDKVARWQNNTLVRKAAFTNGVDPSGGFTYSSVTPFARRDITYNGSVYTAPICNINPPGFCGEWLQPTTVPVGDLGALSAQEVQDTVDDILACAAPDSTHAKYDHNCYLQSGSKDFRLCKKIGWKGVGAVKSFHGRLGFLSTDACASAGSADQVRYLTQKIDIEMSIAGTATVSYMSIADTATVSYESVSTNYNDSVDAGWSSQVSINRYSGVKTQDSFSQHYTGDCTADYTSPNPAYDATYYRLQSWLFWENEFCLQPDFSVYRGRIDANEIPLTPPPPDILGWASLDSNGCGITGSDLGTTPAEIEAAIAAMNFGGNPSGGPWTVDMIPTDAVDANQTITVNSVTVSDTVLQIQASVHLGGSWTDDMYSTGSRDATLNFSITITLSNPYTAAEFYADWEAAAQAWDLTSDAVYPWRWGSITDGVLTLDETLANLPMVIYDENPPVVPAFAAGTMNDYNTPVSVPIYNTTVAPDVNYNYVPTMVLAATLGPWTYDPNNYAPNTGTPPPTNWTASATPGYGDWPVTWAQITWQDPTSYVWKYGNGSYNVPPLDNIWPGATLISGLLSGDIVSHNPPGYDRHFWFKAGVWERDTTLGDDPDPPYTWNLTGHGKFSNSKLPETALRWQDQPFEAQYDSLSTSATPPPGNLPQSWLRNKSAVLIGAKYVETRLPWPSVNFGRPYGKDKYAVDQTTVCAWTVSGGNYTLTKTNEAIAPLATGGLQAGDFVMVQGVGIFPVATLVASGSNWTMTLGTMVSAIPTGADFPAIATAQNINLPHDQIFLGRLRWWKASPPSPVLSKPPPFGLLACTGVYDSGTNKTTFTIPATPFWIEGTLVVDLYLPDAGNGNPHTLLAASQTLTKVSVTDLTGTVPGDYHTATFLIPHLHFSGVQFLPEYDDDRPKGDFVKMSWIFNQRGASLATGSQPAWLGGTGSGTGSGLVGCTEIATTQEQIRFTPCCPAVVGDVVGNTLEAGPNGFKNEDMDLFPASFAVDDRYGAWYQEAVETTMTDPFYQRPFAPDATANLTWLEDDGAGIVDNALTTPQTKYFPHHPLVEARCSLPTNLGWGGADTPPALTAAGVSLTFDPAVNVVYPPYWPNGIPIAEDYTGDGDGSFTDIARPFGFYLNVCSTIATNRFAAAYAYVAC